jgi:hypothetical protein
VIISSLAEREQSANWPGAPGRRPGSRIPLRKEKKGSIQIAGAMYNLASGMVDFVS